MLPKIITLVTSKGGAGKSSLVRSLACHWFNLGLKPGIIDADPQGSINNMHDRKGLVGAIPVVFAPEENVVEKIEEMKEKYRPVLVDTGGFRNRTTIVSLISSDLALVPLKESI